MKIQIHSMELLIVSNNVKIQLLLVVKLTKHVQNYLHHELYVQPDEYILLDHLVDHIGQSNQLLVYLNHVQQRLYIKEYQFQHYKIGRKLLYVLFVFVCPESKKKNKINANFFVFFFGMSFKLKFN